MKKYITVSLFIFWAIVVAILVAGLVFYNQNNGSLVVNNYSSNQQAATTTANTNNNLPANSKALVVPNSYVPKPQASTPASTPTQTSTGTTLTTSEVAKHNTASDCWVIVSGNVYNVTNYLGMHPAGANAIIPYCGQDITVAFNSIKGGRGHSSQANSILQNYFVGQLNQTVSASQTPVLSPTNTVNTGIGDEMENDN
jgi:cytochrome b involved in lipid metabolism